MTALPDFCHKFVKRSIYGDKINVNSRNHHLFYSRFAQLLNSLNHITLFFVKNFLLLGRNVFQ